MEGGAKTVGADETIDVEGWTLDEEEDDEVERSSSGKQRKEVQIKHLSPFTVKVNP